MTSWVVVLETDKCVEFEVVIVKEVVIEREESVRETLDVEDMLVVGMRLGVEEGISSTLCAEAMGRTGMRNRSAADSKIRGPP